MATWQLLIFVTVTKSPKGPPNPSTATPVCTLRYNGQPVTPLPENGFNASQNDSFIINSTGYYLGHPLPPNCLPNTGITTINPPSGLFEILPSSDGMSTISFGMFSAKLGDYPEFTISGWVGDPVNSGTMIPWTVDPKISITAP